MQYVGDHELQVADVLAEKLNCIDYAFLMS
jgi:hypothetical protein